jgi:hypothetical protein
VAALGQESPVLEGVREAERRKNNESEKQAGTQQK